MSNIPSYLEGYETLYQQDPREAGRQWFREARYGMMVCYGVYSVVGRHEWLQYREKIRPADYAALADFFTAEHFDAAAICDLAVEAGMRYINLTTRHCDSFALWDTRQTTFNSVRGAPAGRDLVAEMAEACAARKLGLCLYYNHGRDWRHPHAPNNDQYGKAARPDYDPLEPTYAYGKAHDLRYYLDYMTAQITELLENYGSIAAIWLDSINTPLSPKNEQGEIIDDYEPTRDGDPFRCQALYDHIHSLQPQVLVSYKQGYLGTEDFFAPEHKAYNRFGRDFTEITGEICTSMMPYAGWGGTAWGHMADFDGQHRDAETIWQLLTDARSNHCNLLLNTGPLPDGSLHPEDPPVMRAVGERLRREGFPGEAETST